MENPKFIAQGSQGCVYKPGFECEDPNINIGHENDVMKVQDVSVPVNEYEQHIINILKEIDPRQIYFAYIEKSCKLNIDKFNKGYDCDLDIVNPIGYFMKDAGPDLFTIAEQGKKKLILKYMIYWIRDILAGLILLQSREIVHGDIKLENITIDRETRKAKLIDFGISFKFSDVDAIGLKNAYPILPPFINICNEATRNDLRSNISDKAKYVNYASELGEKDFFRGLAGYDYLVTIFNTYKQNPDAYIKTIKSDPSKIKKIDVFSLGYAFFNLIDWLDLYSMVNKYTLRLLEKMTHIDPNQQYDASAALEEAQRIIAGTYNEPAQPVLSAVIEPSGTQESNLAAASGVSSKLQDGGHKARTYKLKYSTQL